MQFTLHVLFLRLVSVLASTTQTRLTRYPLLEGVNITTGVTSYSKNNIAAECVRPCVDAGDCESFFFNSVTGECQYHEMLFITSAGAKYQSGLKYYYIIKGLDDWCPTNKGFQLLATYGPCVKFHNDTKTWYEANQTCSSLSSSSRLVVLDNQERNDLVRTAGIAIDSHFNSRIWIGLSEYTDDVYRWVDGTDANFTDWGSSISNTSATDCVFFRRSEEWKWSIKACSNLYHYICEIKVDVEQYHGMMGGN